MHPLGEPTQSGTLIVHVPDTWREICPEPLSPDTVIDPHALACMIEVLRPPGILTKSVHLAGKRTFRGQPHDAFSQMFVIHATWWTDEAHDPFDALEQAVRDALGKLCHAVDQIRIIPEESTPVPMSTLAVPELVLAGT